MDRKVSGFFHLRRRKRSIIAQFSFDDYLAAGVLDGPRERRRRPLAWAARTLPLAIIRSVFVALALAIAALACVTHARARDWHVAEQGNELLAIADLKVSQIVNGIVKQDEGRTWVYRELERERFPPEDP